jgi:hypothetical protein
MRARVRVQPAFNATGAPASIGRIVRAAIVVAASVGLFVAVMAGLGSAHAGFDDGMSLLKDRAMPTISLAIARHQAASASTACLPASIKAALATADRACGITVISTLRPGARIAGTNRPSMHASCRAADFTSRDFACAIRALANWPGKLSVDPHRVHPPHLHIDDGRYARFEHGHSRRYAKRAKRQRLARHHGRRG